MRIWVLAVSAKSRDPPGPGTQVRFMLSPNGTFEIASKPKDSSGFTVNSIGMVQECRCCQGQAATLRGDRGRVISTGDDASTWWGFSMTPWHTRVARNTRSVGTRCAIVDVVQREDESDGATYVPASMAAVRINATSQHKNKAVDSPNCLGHSWV